jgi:membrane protease YdiL (CAAX protease family)
VEDTQAAPLSLAPAPAVPAAQRGPLPLPKWFAILQAIAVCGIPTQILVASVLAFVAMSNGSPILDGDGVSIQFFATVSLVDTAVVALLIRLFLALSGESSTKVFVGRRPVRGEILRGVALVPVAMIGVAAVVAGIRTIAPWTHTVEHNPLDAFMRTPLEAGIFMAVVILAGGVREELERAFVLHRFDKQLGFPRLGLAIFTLTFSALHLEQGLDAALAVGLLGLFWGLMYLKRRSAVLPMVNHAVFDAAQVLQVVIVRALGG